MTEQRPEPWPDRSSENVVAREPEPVPELEAEAEPEPEPELAPELEPVPDAEPAEVESPPAANHTSGDIQIPQDMEVLEG